MLYPLLPAFVSDREENMPKQACHKVECVRPPLSSWGVNKDRKKLNECHHYRKTVRRGKKMLSEGTRMCTRELSTGLRRRKAVRNRPAIKWSLFVPLSPAGGSTRSEKAKRVALATVRRRCVVGKKLKKHSEGTRLSIRELSTGMRREKHWETGLLKSGVRSSPSLQLGGQHKEQKG